MFSRYSGFPWLPTDVLVKKLKENKTQIAGLALDRPFKGGGQVSPGAQWISQAADGFIPEVCLQQLRPDSIDRISGDQQV